ncbi:MAG: YciI family protein [Pseudomonadota bacterium]
MKYLALLYSDYSTDPDFGSPEFAEMMAAYQAANDRFVADNVMAGGEALQGPETATTLKVRNGKTETMDGPFAETKEQLGGFYIFDCENLDEAIKYAAMIPAAKEGSVEIRPIMELPE